MNECADGSVGTERVVVDVGAPSREQLGSCNQLPSPVKAPCPRSPVAPRELPSRDPVARPVHRSRSRGHGAPWHLPAVAGWAGRGFFTCPA